MAKAKKGSTGKGTGTKANASTEGKAERARTMLAARVIAVTNDPVKAVVFNGVRIDNPCNASKQACLRAFCNVLGEKAVDSAMLLRRAFARCGGLHRAGSDTVLLGNAGAEYSGYVRHELAGKHAPKAEAVQACADFAEHYMAGKGKVVLASGNELSAKLDLNGK